MATGFESLDMVDLERVFEVRALVMKSVPGFIKGAFRGAMKISLEEIKKGAVGKQCGDHHTWMEIVHVVAEDVALQTTPRRTYSAQEGRRKVSGIQRW